MWVVPLWSGGALWRKLIFLDLDGVLNNRTTMDRVTVDPENPFDIIDPVNVKALNRITDATGAWIVVSSTWRFRYPARSIMQIVLSSKGVTGLVEGTTPRLPGFPTRGDEIQAWRNAHPDWKDVQFIVIDDNSDISPFEDRFIKTDPEFGLTETDADKAIELLGGVNG